MKKNLQKVTLCYEVFGRPSIPEGGKILWAERNVGSDEIKITKLVDKPTNDLSTGTNVLTSEIYSENTSIS